MADKRPAHQWFTNQPAQRDFFHDYEAAATCYAGGWGSGKTWAGSRKLLRLHQLNRCPGLAIAPTWGDVWRIVVPAIVSACQSVRWPHRVVKGVAPHVLVGRHPIWLLSGDAPERITGIEVGHAWVDEAARLAESSDPLQDGPTQLRGRLRHPDAKTLHLLVTTTHEGTGTWVYRDWFGQLLPGHRAYTGRTAGNTSLRPEYLAARTATLSASLAAQYLDGGACDYAANRAHPGFRAATHVRADEIDPRLPLHIGQDFNVSPLCWVLLQIRNAHDRTKATVHVLDEVVVEDHATIEQGMHLAHGKGWGKGIAVNVHPDASAKNRSTTGNPIAFDVGRIARELRWPVIMRTASSNPPIAARIALVDGLIDPVTGPPRLTVHPRCVRLIRELGAVKRLKSGPYDPGKDGKLGHILDALGYALWSELRPGGAVAHGGG
jgi:hypothetical protein